MEWGLLAGIPADDVRRVLQAARRRSFKRDEIIFHEDDPADALHLIAKGKVSVRTANRMGRSVTLAIRAAGEFVGEMALIGEPPTRAATVVAIEPSDTFAVHRADFDALRSRHPSLNEVLVAILTDRVRELSRQLSEALYEPADVRVRRRLLDLADVYDADGDPIPISQESLAELAGTTRATVNRVLRDEVARGTVQLGRSKVTMLDPDAIRRRAH